MITDRFMVCFYYLCAPVLFVLFFHSAAAAQTGQEAVNFEIRQFIIKGNTIFNEAQLQESLKPFIGKEKTAKDVEKARIALEKYCHKLGYPTVLVNIPEQTVESGEVILEVIESKVRRVKVTGNRYFTRERLLREMPAFQPGEILYLPRIKEQLGRVNRNPDLKVAPILMPGKKLGTIDVEFRVKDKLPLHGSLGLNNRSTHTTSDLRVNGMLRYDNLWQKEHSIVMQYQTAPKETDEVQLVTFSYGMPSLLNKEHMAAIYMVWSDSDTASADNISVIGEGYIAGLRYMMPLLSFESYIHDLVLGIDYKDFDDDFGGIQKTPVRYMPLYASYTAVMPDAWGQTRFNATINFNLRQFGSDIERFEKKRAGSRGNYLYAATSLARHQKLFWGMHLWSSIGGQLASQPLVSNEQYIAGGVDSVRGYKENEAAGDDAFYGSVELRSPELGHLLKIGKKVELVPYLFYDAAALHVQDSLPGEDANITLQGAGAGVRGYLFKHLEYQVDWSIALESSEEIEYGDSLVHFTVKFNF